jgi:hypothetical protein
MGPTMAVAMANDPGSPEALVFAVLRVIARSVIRCCGRVAHTHSPCPAHSEEGLCGLPSRQRRRSAGYRPAGTDLGTSAVLVVSGLGVDFSVGVLDGVGLAFAGYSPGTFGRVLPADAVVVPVEAVRVVRRAREVHGRINIRAVEDVELSMGHPTPRAEVVAIAAMIMIRRMSGNLQIEDKVVPRIS